MLIDGHLDLAYNALNGRDLTLTLDDLRAVDPVEGQTATTTFSEMKAVGARVCFGTLFALPRTPDSPDGYTDHAGARAQALAQLDVYRRWEDGGLIRLLRSGAEVGAHLKDADAPLGVVLLMEGADPVRDADDLPFWVDVGVRLMGPAWGATRYAGGTNMPGPLTDAGKALVAAMRDLGLPLDASHLDDAAFWDAAEIGPKMIASHSNSRSLVSGNRHLSDEMACAIAGTGGVIGLVFLSEFIKEGVRSGATLDDLAAHARHYAGLIGWDRVALGSDMDGGFGAEKTPVGIGRYADMPRFLEKVPEEHRAAVSGDNWLRWLTANL
ncbi:dipeptidase [Deinococcus arenicola]|uniref:Membrane dipeptidase n=1 Tax=Deinococcus arenicola TaxID=2994950 RepID=A0ABU4DNM8_9DEIO|nr:membrane dipeptidase [Deinococcus sp. ZS9-10]MDV6374025.1 membrane dipeptidase [Deinococcus sp. ZS9-10]